MKPEEYGPAMLDLSDKQRAFVIALFNQTKPNQAEAARIAGYEGDTKTIATTASRVMHTARVRDAIQEYAKSFMRSDMVPRAIRAMQEIVNDPMHKDRMKTASRVLDLFDPIVSKQEVQVTHKSDHHQDALDVVRELKALGVARDVLEEKFGYTGLLSYEAQLALEAPKDHAIIIDVTPIDEDAFAREVSKL